MSTSELKQEIPPFPTLAGAAIALLLSFALTACLEGPPTEIGYVYMHPEILSASYDMGQLAWPNTPDYKGYTTENLKWQSFGSVVSVKTMAEFESALSSINFDSKDKRRIKLTAPLVLTKNVTVGAMSFSLEGEPLDFAGYSLILGQRDEELSYCASFFSGESQGQTAKYFSHLVRFENKITNAKINTGGNRSVIVFSGGQIDRNLNIDFRNVVSVVVFEKEMVDAATATLDYKSGYLITVVKDEVFTSSNEQFFTMLNPDHRILNLQGVINFSGHPSEYCVDTTTLNYMSPNSMRPQNQASYFTCNAMERILSAINSCGGGVK